MRTSFSRQFGLTAGMILLSFVLLGCSFTSLFYNYMLREEKTSLSTNASAVAAYVGAQSTLPEAGDWELQLSISYGAGVSDTDVVLVNTAGELVLCSCSDFHCEHVGKSLPTDFFEKLRQEGYVYATGALTGIYEDERYLYGVPIRAADSQTLLGYVVVSTETRDMSAMMSRHCGTVSVYGGAGTAFGADRHHGPDPPADGDPPGAQQGRQAVRPRGIFPPGSTRRALARRWRSWPRPSTTWPAAWKNPSPCGRNSFPMSATS